MSLHPRAGSLPLAEDIIDIDALLKNYFTLSPDMSNPKQRVSFGTSGHRGSANLTSFNENHILAITQAVCDMRKANNVQGLLFLGMDTHALSKPAFDTALEVLIANEVHVAIQPKDGFTTTPAVSHAILKANKGKAADDFSLSDGIIITPSHNPPSDGGFKYNPPHGGPADTDQTAHIEKRANDLLLHNNKDVKRVPLSQARTSKFVVEHNYISEYVNGLTSVLDMPAIAASGLHLGVDPLGGASVDYWQPIADKYKINLTIISKTVDSTFRNVPLDHDGKIRMDCSSPYAMSSLLSIRDKFDIAFSCDPDSDRHGIVTKEGLLPPNHYLAVVTDYLFQNRPLWSPHAAVGKTVVTSSMLNKIAAKLGREVYEVPVGFKWFVQGLLTGTCGLGCEESAGASFLCFDGSPWSTDKDGPLLCLLAAEIAAKTGKTPDTIYSNLEKEYGKALYERLDSPASDDIRHAFQNFKPSMIQVTELAGSPITSILTKSAGNNASIGGLKIETKDGWFAARPSGTENICKIYTEGFKGEEHFRKLQSEASDIVNNLVK